MPGSRIPIVGEFGSDVPDIVLILPWNLRDEIIGDLSLIFEANIQYLTYQDMSRSSI
jgi:hypothetical protein